MESITKNADGHLGARDVGQLHGAGETLVTLRVIVLQTNLELNGLRKVSLLLLRSDNNCADGFAERRNTDFAGKEKKYGQPC